MVTPDDPRALTRAFYDFFRTGDLRRVDEVLDAGWVNHPGDIGRSADVAGFSQGVADLRAALDGLTIDVEQTVEEGDFVVCRIQVSGIFVSPFAGIAPSGRPAGFAAMDMHRIEAGRIAETWHYEHLEQLDPDGQLA